MDIKNKCKSVHNGSLWYYFFHRNFSLVFQRLLLSVSPDLLPAAKLVLIQTLLTSAGSVNLLILSSLPSVRMSQKSLRLPFDGACLVFDFGEGEEPESVLKFLLGVKGVVGHVFIDGQGGVRWVLLDLGLSKSSRMEVSPIRSVRKELWREVGVLCSGVEEVWTFSLWPWTFLLVLVDDFGSCWRSCAVGLDNMADVSWLKSAEERPSLSAKAAVSADPRPLLLARSEPTPPPALEAPEPETLALFVLLCSLVLQTISSCHSDCTLGTSLGAPRVFFRGTFFFLWGSWTPVCGFLGFFCDEVMLFCGVPGLDLGFLWVYFRVLWANWQWFCRFLVSVWDSIAAIRLDAEEVLCVVSGCGKSFVTVLDRPGWFRDM